ncbi:MAG: restriction endonuclease subunit S [Methanoregula sp.]|nr:restriction endonuclease subunit S [Methanoregula sp.]
MGERELPEGWEWKRLGEAADINMGQSPSGTSYNENGNGTPFLQGNAEFGDTFPKHKKFTTEPSKIASKGSVLISVRAPVGDTNIADLNYCIGRGLASISLKNGDNKYLLYLLRSMKPMIEAKGTGSTFKAISKSIINEIEIPLPPLRIQRQIVAVLEKVEAVKRQRQEADALTGVLLQSVFLEMFGDPVRNEKGWEWKKLGGISDIIMGQSPPGTSYNNEGIGTPFLQGNAEFGERFPCHNKFTTESSKIAPRGSVLISVRAPVGDINIANIDYCIGRGLASISLEDGDNLYLYFFLQHTKSRIQEKSTGSVFKAISKSIIHAINVPLPPLHLQHKFASIVKEIESISQIQKKSYLEIKNLSEMLSQKAFNGELGILSK